MSLLKPHEGHTQEVTPFSKPTKDNEYEIESILAHRTTTTGAKKYLVKWKGYTYEESTWEPESNFKPHTLREYHTKRKREKDSLLQNLTLSHETLHVRTHAQAWRGVLDLTPKGGSL